MDLQEFSADFRTIVCDVSSPEKVAQLAAQVGEIDILLNTAGRLDDYRTMEDTDFSLWKKILATNLDSMFLVTSAFLPQMKKQKSGAIINMASVAGLVAGGGGIAYTASKHAIVGFTKQLALDEAQHGIQVAGIAPGAIDTPMNAKDFTENNGEMLGKTSRSCRFDPISSQCRKFLFDGGSCSYRWRLDNQIKTQSLRLSFLYPREVFSFFKKIDII